MVHFGDHMVPTQLFAVFIELLSKAEGHGFVRDGGVNDWELAVELLSNALGFFLDGSLGGI